MNSNNIAKNNEKPAVFSKYTADILWNDPHISKMMLATHLDQDCEGASKSAQYIEQSVEHIITSLQLTSENNMIDFGCGPGLYTSQFAIKGVKVTGIDFSTNSINYARKKAEEMKIDITYINQNYLEYKSDKQFNLATLIYCDYCALSKKQRYLLLRNIHSSLKEDGYFIFDVFTHKAYKKREDITRSGKNLMNGFWSAKEYYCDAKSFSYDDDKVFLDKYTIVEKNRTFEVYNWLQYFSLEKIKEEVRDNGFIVLEFFEDTTGKQYGKSSDTIAITCQKV